MAAKRTATSELNHDNWDEEDQAEESGVFRTASKEEIQRRVIRTGRRRVAGASQEKKGIFSAFSGFNKPAPSSFDFLSNLTNGAGAKPPNGSSLEKTTPGGLFGGAPIASSTAILNTSPTTDSTAKSSLFGMNKTTNDTKLASPLFGQSSTPSMSPMFGTPSNSSSDTKPGAMFGISPLSTPSTMPSSKPATMFGIPSTASSPASGDSKPTTMFGIPSKSTSPVDSKASTLFGIPSKSSPPMFGNTKPDATFGIPPITKESKIDSIFGIPSNASTPMPSMKIPPVSSVSSIFSTGSKNVTSATPPMAKNTSSNAEYYSKLKGLNESVSEWIKKHVNENPLCILTPIFRDYERYLKELEEEHGAFTDEKTDSETKSDNSKSTVATSVFTTNSSMLSNAQSTSSSPASKPSAGFPMTSTAPTSTPFTFGTTPATSAPAPFSFGIGSTFSFNANVQKPAEEENKEDEDEPPKVEYNPIAEENSVFDKRCKIFFKKDGNFVDKGVGTLYIKTIENSSKYQLIVRANTSLATVLINFILGDSIPTQRMGKNNVMVVCIPTPDSKPPPVPVLIRVKTSEEADQLLETLIKYKK